MADYKISYTRGSDLQVFLIPNHWVSDEWHQNLMLLKGHHRYDYPDLEHLAILGVMALYCGDIGHLEWAEKVRDSLRDKDLRKEIAIKSEEIEKAGVGACILQTSGNKSLLGIWTQGSNPAQMAKHQIHTHRPVWCIDVEFS